MTDLVADTSALVSLGIGADEPADPLATCLDAYRVRVPAVVVEELEDVASYDDDGRAARAVLDNSDAFETRSVDLDVGFPLDDGENAAVTLANERESSLLLCDEFNQLGLVHASLVDTRLLTTPTLLAGFVRSGRLPESEALSVLDVISSARSWEANSYVQRARSLLDDS